MKTNNTELLDISKNREYYSQSDGNFMPVQNATRADKVIDRMAWLVDKVLDLKSSSHVAVGCKDGYEVLTLKAQGVNAIGIEPCIDSVEEAKSKAAHYGWDGDKMFLNMFAEDIPGDIKAETVSCMEVIEHVLDENKLLKVLSRIGDYVMISTPEANGRHGIDDALKNKEHVRIFTKEELEELVKGYGDIIESVVRDDQICILFKSKKS